MKTMNRNIKTQLTMIVSGMIVFIFTEIIAVASVHRASSSFIKIDENPAEVLTTAIAFSLVFLGLLALFRYFRERNLFGFFFYLSLFFGLNFLLSLYLPWIGALLIALALFLGKALGRRVITQNLALLPGLAGISVAVGLAFTPYGAMFLLLVLSFYDIVAVYFTKHMISLFRRLLSSGVIPAIIIPERFSGFLRRTYEVTPGFGFMLLGTGDIIVPAVFIVSVSALGWPVVMGSIVGSLLGFAATETIFTHQHFRRPMPALPPIATGTILGFLIGRLLY